MEQKIGLVMEPSIEGDVKSCYNQCNVEINDIHARLAQDSSMREGRLKRMTINFTEEYTVIV